jgi:spore coat polysaccharide biosynthesis protein SpsF
MTTVIVVQARMSSTRLPGKVLKPILGYPMLYFQLERLMEVKQASRIVVATTTSPADDLIAAFCLANGFEFIRGSEDDVLSRYAEVATQFDASCIVRITSDCPLIDPPLVDFAISVFTTSKPPFDYVSNMIDPSWPYGMAVEVFSAKALLEANSEASQAAEREHVTPFIYWRPDRFRVKSITMTPDFSFHRWTVDTAEDFELVERIFKCLYPINPHFRMLDVMTLLDKHPEWLFINRHIIQKSLPTPQLSR